MTRAGFAVTIIPAFYTVFGTSYQIDLMNWYGSEQHLLYAVAWYPAYILMIFLAARIRATGPHLTLPDRFMQYGALAELLTSVVAFIYLMPLDVMLILGVIGSMLTGYALPIELFIVVFGLFLIAFTAWRPWSGYSLAGVVYFVFMGLGIGVASLMLVQLAGGWGLITSTVPRSLLTPWIGDLGGYLKLLINPANAIWFLMGSAFLIDPMVWQRVSLVDKPESAQQGMVFAMIFWMIFDLATVYTGLAVAKLGGVYVPLEIYYLDVAFEHLPEIWAGLMITGNLMAALAGGSAYLHAGGMIFSQNIAKALGILPPKTLARDRAARRLTRYGIVILGFISMMVILPLNYFLPEDPTTMAWLINSGVLFGGIAWPIIFGGIFLREKVPSEAVTWGIICGLAVTLGAMVYGFVNPTATGSWAFNILPADASGTPFIDASRVLGLLASIGGYCIGWVTSLVRR